MNEVIILLGPTGVGKTATSILLAKLLNTEIISSDSMQVYRHMDIGTAKPSKKERQALRHHMIDIIEPWEYYSAGEYIEGVKPIIANLHSKGKIPLIVGGTGLYIKAMTRGIFKGPSADWDLRKKLFEKEKSEKGSLYLCLQSVDPIAASKIMPTDTRRIIRALEVYMKSKKTMSEMHQTLTTPLPYKFIKIGIIRDRKELYRMIEQRVDKMIEQGLVEEVKMVIDIINRHFSNSLFAINPSSLSSMQAIGYKEIVTYLSGDISLKDAINLIKKHSRNYAKRQFTWFKKEEGIHWIDITGIYNPDEILQRVTEKLECILKQAPIA